MFSLTVFRHSLNTRITVFTLAIFLAGLWALALFAAHILRSDMQHQLGEQQFAAVSLIAAQLDEHLEDRLVILQDLAKNLDQALLADPGALQAHLERNFQPLSLFSGGLFMTDVQGVALAELPTGTGWTGIDFSDRDAVTAALRGSPSVGTPVIGHMPKVPVFGIAVPLHNGEQVTGAMVGVIALDHSGFLDQITLSRYGKSGGYFLVSIPQRLIITSTHRNRIMQPLAPPGIVPAIDRFLEGAEGSAVYVNQMGVEVLNSSKRLKTVTWGVSASIPTSEAFAPIRKMQQNMLLMTISLSLIAGLATAWMLRRELLPVHEAAEILARTPVSGVPQPLPIRRADEVGALITRFNQLLTQLGEREQAMIRSESKFRTLFDSTTDAVLMLDERGFIDCNPAALCMFGCATREEICALHPSDLSPPTQNSGQSSRELAEAHIHTAITDGHARFDWIHRRADTGETFDAEVLLNAIQIEGRLLLQATCRNISERKSMEEQIRKLAFHDTLTGLANRRMFHDRLLQAITASTRGGMYGAVMFLDLDHFKPLNDAHGHEVGDLLLIEVATRIRACLRDNDTPGRFGGDEFVVLLGPLSAEAGDAADAASHIAERIRRELAAPYRLPLRHDKETPDQIIEHRCTASIGVTLFSHLDKSADVILKRADDAMYLAKEAGRDTVRLQVDDGQPLTVCPVDPQLVQLLWRPAYASGNALIDEQHRELLKLANALLAAKLDGSSFEELRQHIERLTTHVAQHFHDEEKVLRAAGFPGLERHAAIHRDLLARATELVERFHQGKLDLGELFLFLAQDVVARHMLGADRDFRLYLVSDARMSATASAAPHSPSHQEA
jgi:diguanylate cyclase (GGDEF)-like protein/hemerythrin-like metal-binding protein/PAS domain S-box-containing protein